jgi:hypothetical protein
MTQFEYLQTDTPWPKVAGETVDLPLIWEGLELGKNGWELVNVVRTPSGTLTSVFKRVVPAVVEMKAEPVKKGGRK